MRYQGGKSRIANPVSEVITNAVFGRKVENITIYSRNNRGGTTLVSLFCGTCSVESKLAPHFEKVICNDAHKYLVAMLDAAKNGYEFPDEISEDKYKYICEHKDENPALTGLVGFGCSFGGKWFGGYARGKSRNYCLDSKRSLTRDMQTLKQAEFICGDYRAVNIPENSVVYADPPYHNTTGYSVGRFDSAEFWEYMRELARKNTIFVSEQTAPEDFECIWERPFTRTLDRNKNNQFRVTEKLFTYKK